MQLQQHQERLDRLGVKVLVVTFQAGPVNQAYVSETGLKWPLLVDDSGKLYQAYGMGRGSWWDIYGLASISVYLKLIFRRGRRLKVPQAGADVHQLGGDVLIDPDGVVRLQYVGAGPADRPAVESLLEIVRKQVI